MQNKNVRTKELSHKKQNLLPMLMRNNRNHQKVIQYARLEQKRSRYYSQQRRRKCFLRGPQCNVISVRQPLGGLDDNILPRQQWR